MTQERYQEAAEHYAARAKQGRRYASHGPSAHLQVTEREIARVIEHAERDELAAEVLTKLASGFVLVPAEPTQTMIAEAGAYDRADRAHSGWSADWGGIYRTMLAAAPVELP